MACPPFTANGQPMVSLCDRLKHRYENQQPNWHSLFQGQIEEKNARDVEFIRYIVNTIIEQAKHNIVISELPDMIRTLHCETEAIIRKNRMITLEEAIAQVQLVGAKKYPYLKKVKPLTTADFVKEVMREVFSRLGTIATLDMIENICQFTTCSTKQLLDAMPAIDVNEAASLIIEDILRNQNANSKGQKSTEKSTIKETSALAAFPSTRSTTNRNFKESHKSPSTASKEWRTLEGDSLKSMRNSNHAHTKTKPPNASDRHEQNWSNNGTESTDKLSLEFAASSIDVGQMSFAKVAQREEQRRSTEASPSTCVPCDKAIRKTRALGTTSSIHSEEGPSMNTRSALNANATSSKKISPKSRPFVLEAMRHYTKHRHHYYDISDNDEPTTESEAEHCSLGAIFRHRSLGET